MIQPAFKGRSQKAEVRSVDPASSQARRLNYKEGFSSKLLKCLPKWKENSIDYFICERSEDKWILTSDLCLLISDFIRVLRWQDQKWGRLKVVHVVLHGSLTQPLRQA